MPTIVQKYGGTSVGTAAKLRDVAQRVAARVAGGDRLVVVVSAMGHTTDELVRLASEVSPNPTRRELDMLLTAGERISMALLSMALNDLNVPAISFTGSQSGIITTEDHSSARILEVRPFRIREELERGKVVIVAGFQGVSRTREITTLGRGGSDTTAVALAAALNADACEIYSDVDGVFTADPRVTPQARRLVEIGYEEMQTLAEGGARVLNAQAVEFARSAGIVIEARATAGGDGTRIRESRSSYLRVSGVTGADACLRVVVARQELSSLSALLTGTGAAILDVRLDTESASVWLGTENVPNPAGFAAHLESVVGTSAVQAELARVTVVGRALTSGPGLFQRALDRLEREGIRVVEGSLETWRMTFGVSADRMRDAIRALHDEFIGDAPD